MLIKIILGLIGLGIVVFVHELGHFLAARMMGIGVDAFSIGWGKPILKKKIGEVEYRLGIFPLGGYCKMKGDADYETVYKNSMEGKKAEEGTYYAASPMRRAFTCLAGPLFNLIFAALVLSVIWGRGFEVNTLGNRIVLASEIVGGSANPADEAGLKTGDRIVSIMGRPTETFHDIQEIIALNPGTELPILVERDGEILELSVTPLMDRSTGAGRIGIYFWTDPLIERIVQGGAAEAAGLQSGDMISRVNGSELPHTMALYRMMEDRLLEESAFGEGVMAFDIEFIREGQVLETTLLAGGEDGGGDLGLAWEAVRYHTPRLSFAGAIVKGAQETWRTFTISVRSLSLLFKGIDLTSAVSGPVRITYMVGEAATQGFNQSFGSGISSMASFLALISIALCIMNLLPLPILDGGMILLFLFEGLRRKPLHPRFVSVFQAAGVLIIASLMIFAIFGDILYLANR
ncbi:MAG: site-2 protease family protein [Treponema sp.]|nr:site-2 protease family protein [Treponema sp.]